MRVHILNDYDYDCEIRKEGEHYSENEPLYEVPDELILEYEAINKRREELQEKILLIERQGRVAKNG